MMIASSMIEFAVLFSRFETILTPARQRPGHPPPPRRPRSADRRRPPRRGPRPPPPPPAWAVAPRGQLHALDLGRVHREGALHAHAEGLLAHRERLARPVPLALDHHPLEDLHAAPRALDDLEVHLHTVAGREARYAPQMRALDCFD